MKYDVVVQPLAERDIQLAAPLDTEEMAEDEPGKGSDAVHGG